MSLEHTGLVRLAEPPQFSLGLRFARGVKGACAFAWFSGRTCKHVLASQSFHEQMRLPGLQILDKTASLRREGSHVTLGLMKDWYDDVVAQV